MDQAPILLAGAPPEYPDLLRRAGIQGRVLVEAVIDTAGRVDSRSVRVLQSAHAGFEEPARRYVLAALFRPARVAGRPVAVRVRIPIDFTIRTSRLPVR